MIIRTYFEATSISKHDTPRFIWLDSNQLPLYIPGFVCWKLMCRPLVGNLFVYADSEGHPHPTLPSPVDARAASPATSDTTLAEKTTVYASSP